MNIHTNARLTPHGRGEIARRVRQGGPAARAVARSVGVSEKTVRRWVARSHAEAALEDRSSRPHRSPQATPPAVVLRVKVLRQRERLTLTQIADVVGMSRTTVGRIVARCGWARVHVLHGR
jgi:transposase